MVEHSLGKGEVVSSILTGSTRKAQQIKNLSERALPFLPVLEREQSVFPPAKLGENPGNLFGKRSAFLDCTSAKTKTARPLARCTLWATGFKSALIATYESDGSCDVEDSDLPEHFAGRT